MKTRSLLSVVAVVALIVLPMSVHAISSTSFEIGPEGGLTNSHSPYSSTDYDLDSTSFKLDASIEGLVGDSSSTSFQVEAGSSFEYYCGDGFRDAAETCDGSNLNSQTCASQGFDSGTLACSSSCAFDTSSCSTSGGGGGGGGGGGSAPVVTSFSDPAVSEELDDVTYTYRETFLLYGTMDDDTDTLSVNDNADDVEFVDDDHWQVSVSLAYGLNSFTLVASDGSDDSDETIFEIYRRLAGDMNEDDTVNDYDLSLLIASWGTEDTSGDFNEDGVVDDYDFSMMVARWGTGV